MGVVSRRDCVNTFVQCMHLELVADLYMYSHVSVCSFFRIVIVHITHY